MEAYRSFQEAAAGAENVPELDGELTLAPEARAEAAKDFGGLPHGHPSLVLRPGSADDVAAMLRYCRDNNIPVAPRGQGHSTFGQAQAPGGLVVDTGTLDSIHLDGDTAVVGAGTRWSELVRAALAQGHTPPVLTDYLELSVGGTLSVGGLGGATHQHGSQTDTVTELEVVTGSGRRTVCSPDREPGLFRAVLAGLGQCAIITRATLRLAPAPETVRRYRIPHPSVTALTANQRRLIHSDVFSYVEGQAHPAPELPGGWRYTLEAASPLSSTPGGEEELADLGIHPGPDEVEDLPYLDFADRMAPDVAYLESVGAWHDPHPWWNAILPDSTVDATVSETMAELRPADVGPTGMALLYPLFRNRLHTPLLRVPDEPVVFLFSLLRTATPDPDVSGSEEMVRANRALYERVRARGGVQYPVGSIPMETRDWREHFGERWPLLAEAKREHDPAGVLTPGPGIFPGPGGSAPASE